LRFDDSVNFVGVFVEPIVAQFILHPHVDENSGRQSDGKTGYIDACEYLVSQHTPDRDFQIVDQHEVLFLLFSTVSR